MREVKLIININITISCCSFVKCRKNNMYNIQNNIALIMKFYISKPYINIKERFFTIENNTYNLGY